MVGSNFKFWNVKKTLDAGLKIMAITLLMRSLCMCSSVQHSSICSHVSGCIILHNEQFMLGYSSFQNNCFLAFPILW